MTIHLRIDALRVRTKGMPATAARGLAEGLGEAIAAALAGHPDARPGAAPARTPAVDLGRIAAGGRSSAALRDEIAARIAAPLVRRAGASG